MDLELKGRRILLSGATGMIGAAAARALAAEGAELALLGREPSRLAPLLAELQASGAPRCIALPCDLASADSTDAAVAAAELDLGPIDVLVTAAGAAQGGIFWEIDDAAWQRNLEAKLFGTIRLLRAMAPRMIGRGAGRIVAIIGNSGKQPEPRMLPGAVANAALLAIVRGLAEELGPHGVAINALNPGPVRSPRWDTMMSAAAARAGGTPAEAEAAFLQKTALRRLATAEEVAQHVAFLASPRAAHMTGTAVTIDGGSTKSI
jgi:NAD(P)-dependent dehydrogenase (short-subunit alcohol dehydrogenase family)